MSIRDNRLIWLAKELDEMLESRKLFVWKASEEPFWNGYSNRIGIDHSGEVVRATVDDVNELLRDVKTSEHSYFYGSFGNHFYSGLYVGEWAPSYVSNHGKNWISYVDELRDRYGRYVYETALFKCTDDDGEVLEGLQDKYDEIELSSMDDFELFFSEMDIEKECARVKTFV